MRQLFTTLLFLAIAQLGLAQISVTATTFPAANDTLRYAIDDRPVLDVQSLFTPPGGPQTWDLSKLLARSTFSQVFKPASVGKNASSYPGAELVVVDAIRETYYNVTNSRFENMGYAGADPFGLGLNARFKLLPAYIERRAAMNFFDINVANSSIIQGFAVSDLPEVIKNNLPVSATLIDSIRVRLTFSRNDVVDAYGTLKLPFAQYSVLREKRTEYISTRIDVHTFLGWLDATDLIVNQNASFASVLGVDTLISHNFFSNTTKEIIAQLNFNTAQNQITSVRFKAPPRATVPVREVQPPTAQLQVIPNPVDEEIQLSFVPLISGKLRIELHDALRRVLKTSQVEVIQQQKMRWQMPGHDLPNGIYTLVLSTADRLETVPLVVQH
ncbi:hypothetical protein [Haliscomenobacter sp.]|uniref:hypothetical protein n=1 Tax=Haliscomenobacter sp. TaxID=2717303 RepID=UPI00359361E9